MSDHVLRSAAPEVDPFDFAIELLEMEGAAVEVVGNRADAILPAGTARDLGWNDLVRLTRRTDEPEPGAHAVGFGSAALERLIERTREAGSVLCLRTEVSSPGARDLASEARRHLRFETKGPVAFGATARSAVSYLRVHYSLAAASEDTREALFAVVINETTLAPVTHLSARLDALGGDVRPGGLNPGVGARAAAEILEAAHREARRSALEQLGPFLQAMDRRRHRAAERLREYYESLAAEAAAAKGRRHQPTSQEAAADRLGAIRTEYERKLRDLDLRYAVRVRLRPAAVERLTVPSLTAPCILRWKRTERQLIVVWNAVLHEIEPLACDACGAATQVMHVGENLRVLCSGCQD